MSCHDFGDYEYFTECKPIPEQPTVKLDIRRDGAAYDELGNFVGKVERFGKEYVLFTTHGNSVLTP